MSSPIHTPHSSRSHSAASTLRPSSPPSPTSYSRRLSGSHARSGASHSRASCGSNGPPSMMASPPPLGAAEGLDKDQDPTFHMPSEGDADDNDSLSGTCTSHQDRAADGGQRGAAAGACSGGGDLQQLVEAQAEELDRLRALLAGRDGLKAPSPPKGPRGGVRSGKGGRGGHTNTVGSPEGDAGSGEDSFIMQAMKLRPSRAQGQAGDAVACPPPLIGHSASFYKGRMIIFGGVSGGTDSDDADAIAPLLWVFNPASGQWSPMGTSGEAPGPRRGHSATVVGNSLVIYGGQREESSVKPTAASTRGAGRRTATAGRKKPQQPRGAAPSPSPPSSSEGLKSLATIYSLDLGSGAWRLVPARSDGERTAALHGHVAAAHLGKVYVFGGVGGGAGAGASGDGDGASSVSPLVRCFDPLSGRWIDERVLNWQQYRDQRHSTAASGDGGSHGASAYPSLGAAPLVGHSVSLHEASGAFVVMCADGSLYRYHVQRREWSAMPVSGVGPASPAPVAMSVVGDTLIAVDTASGEGYALRMGEHGRWARVPYGEHSRTLPCGSGRSTVALPCSAMSGGSGAAVTFLVFGGARQGKDGSSGSKPCHAVWRVSVGGPRVLAALEESRAAKEQQRQSMNSSSPRKPLGPPRCASASPSPRRKANGQQQHYSEQQRSSSVRSSTPSGSASRRRSTLKGANGQLHPRPFSSQTSRRVSCQYFSSYAPTDAIGGGVALPSPRRRGPDNARPRTAADIQKIVDRVSDMRPVEDKRRELERRYLFDAKRDAKHHRGPLTEEEQEEAVNRLYYDEVEAREERLAELDLKYYPPLPEPDMTEDDVYESAERMYAARKMPALPPVTSRSAAADQEEAYEEGADSPSRRAVPLDPQQLATVNRLYYQQLAKSRDHRIRLEERYLWNGSGGVSPTRHK